MDSTPKWIPFLYGSIMILMGTLILGALWGYVPIDGGSFTAPSWVIISLGICLLSAGAAFWLPGKSPSLVKSALLIITLVALALVCNWTAFAPGVEYQSSAILGMIEITGKDQIGGRIVFGLAAVTIDLIILAVFISFFRQSHRK